ncbi:MAG: translation initiation factor IF-2 subunit alpha [Ignisphaera sp.]
MSIPFRKHGIPDVGELVVAQVKKVFDYGAYADLLEYENLEAFIPWSEISTRYVKDIRDVIKENHVVVGKVIRVERRTGKIQIDISIKRVLEGEKRTKILRWKRIQRAQKIIEMATKNSNRSLEDAYKYVWTILEREADPLSVLEEAVLKGPQLLVQRGIPEDWSNAIFSEAQRHISIKTVKIRALAELVCYKSDGIERIKKILSDISSMDYGSNTKVSVYTIGAPRYRIEIEAVDYKIAEDIYNRISRYLEEQSKALEIDRFKLVHEEIEKG